MLGFNKAPTEKDLFFGGLRGTCVAVGTFAQIFFVPPTRPPPCIYLQ